MKLNHLVFLLFIMLMYGSSYPVGKLGTNLFSPLLMGSLRALFLFIAVLPFFRFSFPKINKLHFLLFCIVMGIGVYSFVYLALDASSLISPIIIGAQLSVPFGLILSNFFLQEKISLKKWLLIFSSFIGIIIVAYDPRFIDQLIGLVFIILMALFYAMANILSRYLKEVSTVDQIGWHSLLGFLILFIFSAIVEGNPFDQLYPFNYNGMITAFHAGIFVSLIGHGGLFYLYKYYPVAVLLPFYSLFPIFGIILTFFIFFEIPGKYEIIGGIIVIGSVCLIHLNDKKTKVSK